MEHGIELGWTMGSMLVGAVVPLLTYAFTRKDGAFRIRTFICGNKSRLFYGFLLMLILAVAITFIDGVTSALSAVGFAVHGSAWGAGFAIGGLLVVAIPGDKDKEN